MNIVQVVSSYGIELKKVGKVYQGLCPFHSDNNPSFTVYPETNTFYCFGCGVFGDIYKFIYMIDPSIENENKRELSLLKVELDSLEKSEYKDFLLISSAKIFREMLKYRPVKDVYNIMKEFDKKVFSKKFDSINEIYDILESLKKELFVSNK